MEYFTSLRRHAATLCCTAYILAQRGHGSDTYVVYTSLSYIITLCARQFADLSIIEIT